MNREIEISSLREWFSIHKRSFPWRENSSPYGVWISEVMLQQTRASVVIPYFHRWMKLFPSIPALAKAPREEVLKAWEGLGYYSRARNLHEGAIYLTKHHLGKLPSTREALDRIKGIGPYTAGAILSFAFHKRAAAIDGNVTRVLTRYFGIEREIDLTETQKEVRERLETSLPPKEPWVVMEGLIELGALVCLPTPRCEKCPLAPSCIAKKEGKEKILPKKRKKGSTTHLHRLALIIQSPSHMLLSLGEKGKVMADLWEFPYFELEDPLNSSKENVSFPLPLTYRYSLPLISHTFTRFRAFLYPKVYSTPHPISCPPYRWIRFDELEKKTFSAGHRRILQAHLTQKYEVNQ